MTDTPEPATAMAELLPCPFCGADCQRPQNYGDSRDGLHRFLECEKCCANIYRYRKTQTEADNALYAAWNARVNSPDVQQVKIKRLRERVKVLEDIILAADRANDSPSSCNLNVNAVIYPVAEEIRRAHTLLTPQEPNNG